MDFQIITYHKPNSKSYVFTLLAQYTLQHVTTALDGLSNGNTKCTSTIIETPHKQTICGVQMPTFSELKMKFVKKYVNWLGQALGVFLEKIWGRMADTTEFVFYRVYMVWVRGMELNALFYGMWEETAFSV